MKFIIKKLNNFEGIVMRYKVSILVLSIVGCCSSKTDAM